MRNIFSIFICLTVFIFSCKKAKRDAAIPEGTYAGTFQRLTSTGGEISNVSLTFSENNWEGQSQFPKYPALCHGTYTVTTSENISFENACAWTAEFDWTLILSQDYKVKLDGNKLQIWRDYGTYKDIYVLMKQ